MVKFELGTVIARRELSLTQGGQVVVEIGTPQLDSEIGHFCPYKISGLGKMRISQGAGLDSVHALQMALLKIGIDTYAFNKKNDGAVTWDAGEHDGDVGFPLPQNILDIMKD